VTKAVIEVVAAGARVAVPVDFDENTLRRVLRVVEGR
jgi:acetolactate synthase regulatory subunit